MYLFLTGVKKMNPCVPPKDEFNATENAEIDVSRETESIRNRHNVKRVSDVGNSETHVWKWKWPGLLGSLTKTSRFLKNVIISMSISGGSLLSTVSLFQSFNFFNDSNSLSFSNCSSFMSLSNSLKEGCLGSVLAPFFSFTSGMECGTSIRYASFMMA